MTRYEELVYIMQESLHDRHKEQLLPKSLQNKNFTTSYTSVISSLIRHFAYCIEIEDKIKKFKEYYNV